MARNRYKPSPLIFRTTKKIYYKLVGESIYANASYLLSSWAILSILGFGFWMICTHFFNDEEVGLATGLTASINFITSLSLIGFEMSIIRVLPNYEDKNTLLNACLSMAALAGIAVSTIFLFIQPMISGDLDVIHSNPAVIFIYVFFAIVSISGFITESTFIAYRKSKYVLRKNFILSVFKLIFPFVFLSLGGFGIFSAYMVSLLIAVIYSMVILKREFSHSFLPKISISPLKGMLRYSFGNYVDGFAEGLPIMVLPIFIIDIFGADEAAHYYIAMMLANFLFMVSISATQSMFAEGSYAEGEIKSIITKSLKFTGLFLIPGVIATFLFGSYVLSFFGASYADQATGLLDILALSSFVVALNYIARTIFRIRYRTVALTIISTLGSTVIIGLAYPLRVYSLNGIGFAWLIGQVVTLTAFGILFFWERRRSASA